MRLVVSALPFALALLFGVPTVASAHALHRHARHHHYRHWHYAGRQHHWDHEARGHGRHARYAMRDEHRHVGGLVHEDTAAGNITVAAGAATKFKDLIAALVAKGFRGDVGCYAASGHIAHSLHHSGNACDFAQTGKNRTVAIMYHSGALIRSFGLRDGCSFGDCGHVDTGTAFADRGRHSVQHSYARNERRHVRRERIAGAYRHHERLADGYAGYEHSPRHRGYEHFSDGDRDYQSYRVADSERGSYRRSGGWSYEREGRTSE
jgi:hypothetical protein